MIFLGAMAAGASFFLLDGYGGVGSLQGRLRLALNGSWPLVAGLAGMLSPFLFVRRRLVHRIWRLLALAPFVAPAVILLWPAPADQGILITPWMLHVAYLPVLLVPILSRRVRRWATGSLWAGSVEFQRTGSGTGQRATRADTD